MLIFWRAINFFYVFFFDETKDKLGKLPQTNCHCSFNSTMEPQQFIKNINLTFSDTLSDQPFHQKNCKNSMTETH